MKTLVLIGGISRKSLNKRFFDEMLKHYTGWSDREIVTICAKIF